MSITKSGKLLRPVCAANLITFRLMPKGDVKQKERVHIYVEEVSDGRGLSIVCSSPDRPAGKVHVVLRREDALDLALAILRRSKMEIDVKDVAKLTNLFLG